MTPAHTRGMRINAYAALSEPSSRLRPAPGATLARPPSLLLFNALPDAETAFGVVRPTGKSRRILSREYSAKGWSPSGRQIVAYGGPTGLAILDATGALVRPLSIESGFFTGVTWSPRGGPWLAGLISRCKPTQSSCADLQIKKTDGSEERTLIAAGVLSLGAGSTVRVGPRRASSRVQRLAHVGAGGRTLLQGPRHRLSDRAEDDTARFPRRRRANLGAGRAPSCV